MEDFYSETFELVMEILCRHCNANTRICYPGGNTESTKCALINKTMHKMNKLCVQVDELLLSLKDEADAAARD